MQCQTRQIQVFQPEVYNQQRWPSPGTGTGAVCTVTLGADGALAVAETLCKPNKNTLELVNYATNIKIHNSKHQILSIHDKNYFHPVLASDLSDPHLNRSAHCCTFYSLMAQQD